MKRMWLNGLLALCLATTASAAARVWTDVNGETMQAEFIRESDGEVSFLQGGKLVTKRLDQLSESDQQVVHDLQAGRPVQDDRPPPATAPKAIVDAVPAATESVDKPDQPKTLRKKPTVAGTRVWTDVFGNQMTAKFVRIFDGNVVLSRIGRMSTVRYYHLTSADQEYVKELLTSQGQESLIPPTPPVGTFLPGPTDNEGPFSPNVAPRHPVEAGIPQPPQAVRRGPSELFQDLHERDAKRREQQMQALADAEAARAKPAQHAAVAYSQEQENIAESASTDSAADSSEGTNITVNPPVVGQTQKWLFLAIVIGGVIGIVSVIVFAAMTIASASSVAKQRQYR